VGEVRSETNRLSLHVRYDQIVDVIAPFGDAPELPDADDHQELPG